MKNLRTVSIAGALALLAGTRAAAQAPPGPVPPSAPVAEPAVAPGARVATGQAPVVGGNAAGARERALEDAIRQVVDQALAELVDPQTRAAQAKAVRALEAKAHSFVGSYRTLEEGEANGVYSVRIQAEVDLVALRRKVERWTVPAPGPAPTVAAAPSIVPAGRGGRVPGVHRQAGRAPCRRRAFAHAAAPPVRRRPGSATATVTVTSRDEGALRGTGRVSVACQATARFAGAPLPERAASARAFAETADAGRADCLGRLAGALGADLASTMNAASRRQRATCRFSPSTPTSSSRRPSRRCSRASARWARSRGPTSGGWAAVMPRFVPGPARPRGRWRPPSRAMPTR